MWRSLVALLRCQCLCQDYERWEGAVIISKVWMQFHSRIFRELNWLFSVKTSTLVGHWARRPEVSEVESREYSFEDLNSATFWWFLIGKVSLTPTVHYIFYPFLISNKSWLRCNFFSLNAVDESKKTDQEGERCIFYLTRILLSQLYRQRYKKSMQTSMRNLYVDISLRDMRYTCLFLIILMNHPPILFFLVRTTTFKMAHCCRKVKMVSAQLTFEQQSQKLGYEERLIAW